MGGSFGACEAGNVIAYAFFFCVALFVFVGNLSFVVLVFSGFYFCVYKKALFALSSRTHIRAIRYSPSIFIFIISALFFVSVSIALLNISTLFI